MNHNSFSPQCAERLAAYFEGTLPPQERQQVGNWLADHPEVVEEVRALQQLSQAVRSSAPPEPPEDIWLGMRKRIGQELADTTTRQESSERRKSAWRAGWWAAAAAGFSLLALWPSWREKPIDAVAESAFPIASAEDVEIVSVDAAGARALLVGEPPLQKPLILMAAGDATLKSVEIVPAGQFPEVWMGPREQESPMIVAPFVSGLLNAP